MYDINFFSVLKRSKSKNNVFKVFLIIFILVAVFLNVVLIGGRMLIISQIDQSIEQKEAIINDEQTKEKIREAEMIDREAKLAAQYYNLLQSAGDSIEQMKHIDSGLFDEIRALTPLEVTFIGLVINDRQIRIDCMAENELAAMDMYHAFMSNDHFANVSISSITVEVEPPVPEPTGTEPTETEPTVTEPTETGPTETEPAPVTFIISFAVKGE